MSKRILVIGLGRLGDSLVRHLHEEGLEVLAVDLAMENVEKAKPFAHLAVQGDSSNIEVLQEIGAQRVDEAFICMGESFEASVLTLTNLLDLKVPLITVRASTARNAQVYRSVGAHKVFFVEEEMGRLLAARISRPTVKHEMELDLDLKIIEWSPAPWALEKTVSELALPQKFSVQIIGLRNPVEPQKVIFPEPTTRIKKGYLALLLGRDSDLDRLLTV